MFTIYIISIECDPKKLRTLLFNFVNTRDGLGTIELAGACLGESIGAWLSDDEISWLKDAIVQCPLINYSFVYFDYSVAQLDAILEYLNNFHK